MQEMHFVLFDWNGSIPLSDLITNTNKLWWNTILMVLSFLPFPFEQNKEVTIISLKRMRSRLINQEGEIVGIFRTRREVSRKGNCVTILLRRSQRPYKIWNNLWSSREQPQGCVWVGVCLHLCHTEPKVTQGCSRHFICRGVSMSWEGRSTASGLWPKKHRKKCVVMTPTYLSLDIAGREWGSLHCLGENENVCRLGRVSSLTEGTWAIAEGVIPCDITSLFPWETDSEGSKHTLQRNAPNAVM